MDITKIFQAINECNDDTPSTTLKAIKNGEDINVVSETGETFLHVIANRYSGEQEAPFLLPVIFQLSNAGIKTNVKNQDGETALHVAVKKTRMQKLVRALIMIGVDPKINNINSEEIKELIDEDERDTQICVDLLYPGLWNAVDKGEDELVLRLVNSWCNLEEIKNGKPLMNLVHLNLNEKTANMIEKSSKTMKLVYASLAKDKKAIKKALKDPNVDVNIKNATYIGEDNSVFFMPLAGEIALLHLTGCLEKLLKSGADVNVIVDEVGCAEPLFLYIMRTLPKTEDAYDVLEVMLPYANFSLVKDKTSIICSIAFEKRLPFAIVKIMISKGLNLFERDENGHTLRDTIYLNTYKEGKDSLRLRLGFVDQVLIDIALEGDMLMLERLSLNSYDYDQVENRRGQSMIEVVSEKGKEDVVKYLESLPELQRTIRRIHVAIETGNLHEIKQHMINRLADSRDKGGRGLLHKAVLFERRFIIKYFLKEYPEMVHLKDIEGRTPLHWAVCLKEGKDIEDSLMKAGADPSARDKKGRTPSDYSKITESMQETIQKERVKDFGIEVYLLQRYMDFKFAIESGDLTKVENIRNSMYKDISLNDLHVKMYQTKPPPKDLLSLSIDSSQDPIGKYLLSQGIHWDIKYKHGEVEMSAEKAAEQKEMTHTVEAIQYQKNRAAEEKKTLNKVKKEKKEMLEKLKKDGTCNDYRPIPIANGNHKTGRKDSSKGNASETRIKENGNGTNNKQNTKQTNKKQTNITNNNNCTDNKGDIKSCSCTVI